VGNWSIALAPLLGLAANVLAHLAAANAARGKVGVSMMAGTACGLAITLAATYAGSAAAPGLRVDLFDTWLLGIASYLALSFGFWAFLNLNLTSMRIRMLRETFRAGGSIPLAILLERYAPAERLRRRLERLAKGGQLVKLDGRWRLRSRHLLVVAQCLRLMRVIVLPRHARGFSL
jgi:hypothetical protein